MKYRMLACALGLWGAFWLGCGGAADSTPVAPVELPSSDKALRDFWFDPADNPGLPGAVRAQLGDSEVSATLPAGTPLTRLVPRLSYSGVSASPGSGEPQDFTLPVPYTILAADGSSRVYTVRVSVAAPAQSEPVPDGPADPVPSSRCAITGFALSGAQGQITGDRIAVVVPAGTDLGALTPEVRFDGASVEPASGAAHSFSEPVQYTVTAEDGSRCSYRVSVSVGRSTAKEITRFSLAGVVAEIAGDEIRLSVPYGTRIVNVPPRVEHDGVAISPAAGALCDFSRPVVFTVTAEDGSQRAYTVRVSVAPNLSKEITHFKVFGIEAHIDGERIELTLPYGSVLTSLVPQITLSGGVVEPASGVPQDFTQPVTYSVTGADGAVQRYLVEVTTAASNACSISAFRVPGAAALIGGGAIRLILAYGTDPRSLTPEIVHEGASVLPASGTAQDFSQPLRYSVTAADGTVCAYDVSASVAETSDRGIERFAALGSVAAISGDEIALVVPYGANLDALSPEIVHHGARLTPGSGVPQSFVDPVRYTLLERDGQLHAYTVHVERAAVSDTTLTSFSLLGRQGRIVGNTVRVDLPHGTQLAAVAPLLTQLGARVSPVSGTTRNLSQDVIYTVIAADGTRRDYTVSAHVAGPDGKQLTDFALLGVPASIAGDQVSVHVPPGSDLRALRPSFLQHDGASLQPAADAIRDFTQPVRYTVTAADGSTADYVVSALLD